MRITFVVASLELNGGSRIIHTYAKLLQERGHDVCVVTRPIFRSVRQRLRSLVRYGKLPPQIAMTPTLFDGRAYTFRVLDPIRPIGASDVPDADIIIGTWWETVEWVAAYPAAKGKKVHFVQGDDSLRMALTRRFGSRRARSALVDGSIPAVLDPGVDAVFRLPMFKITISSLLEKMLRDRYGVGRVVVVPNSVDTTQFSAPPRGRQAEPTVGIMYHFHPAKDCRTGLEAFESLSDKLPEARLIAFGKFPPPPSLPRRCEYFQSPAQDQIASLYARCDVWMCSSREEGFGLPVLEAMACRCPVVSTAVGGPLDLVTDGREGYVVPVGDATAIAEKLEMVLKLPEAQWRKMSDAAYVKATNYTWSDAADRFEKALEALYREAEQ